MLTVQYAKNLQWENEAHTLFSCIVKYEEINEELPCGVDAVDPYEHIHTLWINGTSGMYGVIAEFVPPPEPTPENQVVTEGTVSL